ncbi:MAG: bifunctional hydroxymethylpyrimidine kinase/phosphomethylpyrimidine kinase [Deltaproteobacteria bacterium]|nr:bifunctional hydroxymethylpyrimidine kinase/phosphomethylpyrimidine kinase [Deltaproteobacteria bacterium]
MLRIVLTIAGSDPSGGAGIQVDLQVFHSLKVNGISAITALTAQNEARFYSMNPVASTLLREQLRSITPHFKPSVIKIGMLGTEQNVLAVYRFLESEKNAKVVLDPIIRSSTGAILLDPKGVAILKQLLIPKVTVVTPNLDEAEVLTGLRVRTIEEMKAAALYLHQGCRGVKAVLVKGGHLEEEATDVLYDGEKWHFYTSHVQFTKKVHGTGCVYSAALASYLARGQSIERSAKLAKDYVTSWIRRRTSE